MTLSWALTAAGVGVVDQLQAEIHAGAVPKGVVHTGRRLNPVRFVQASARKCRPVDLARARGESVIK